MSNSIADIRKDYKLQSLDESEVSPDPLQQFSTWWQEAINSNIEEVNAMTLATADKDGRPSARIVLLKGFDETGFKFFTNYNSRKGKEIEVNPFASLVFFWKELERQVRISGSVSRLSAEESDTYYQSRPSGSRLGAWCSPQSEVIESRAVLEHNLEKYQATFIDGQISRPPHWGGYAVKPVEVEFWQGRPSRLHDRIAYTKVESSWTIARLAP
jgi:pyridoxamine 5'-phosphate oxidase